MAVEKGPLFLTPMEIPGQVKASSADAPAKPAESSEKPQASGEQGEFPRTIVKGQFSRNRLQKPPNRSGPSQAKKRTPKMLWNSSRTTWKTWAKPSIHFAGK